MILFAHNALREARHTHTHTHTRKQCCGLLTDSTVQKTSLGYSSGGTVKSSIEFPSPSTRIFCFYTRPDMDDNELADPGLVPLEPDMGEGAWLVTLLPTPPPNPRGGWAEVGVWAASSPPVVDSEESHLSSSSRTNFSICSRWRASSSVREPFEPNK